MNINSNYLQLLRDNEIDEAKGLFFGFLITHRKDFHSLQSYILDDHVLPYEEFMVLQINLCKVNEKGERELKVPFYSHQSYGEFDLFKSKLAEKYIGGKGHLNNKLEFIIFGPDDEKSYDFVKSKIENFDIDKLVEVVSQYYETTRFASKLSKYLKESAIQDYNLL